MAHEGPPIVDPHHGAAAVPEVGNAHLGAEGQAAVGGGEITTAQHIAVGGATAVETWAVPAGLARGDAADLAVGRGGDRLAGSQGIGRLLVLDLDGLHLADGEITGFRFVGLGGLVGACEQGGLLAGQGIGGLDCAAGTSQGRRDDAATGNQEGKAAQENGSAHNRRNSPLESSSHTRSCDPSALCSKQRYGREAVKNCRRSSYRELTTRQS